MADLSSSEAHLHSNGCIPLQQVLLPHLVPSVGRLDSNSCGMAAAELCVRSTCLPALDLGLNGYSSPALPQEGSAVLEHAPGALYDQHRPAVLQG